MRNCRRLLERSFLVTDPPRLEVARPEVALRKSSISHGHSSTLLPVYAPGLLCPESQQADAHAQQERRIHGVDFA